MPHPPRLTDINACACTNAGDLGVRLACWCSVNKGGVRGLEGRYCAGHSAAAPAAIPQDGHRDGQAGGGRKEQRVVAQPAADERSRGTAADEQHHGCREHSGFPSIHSMVAAAAQY